MKSSHKIYEVKAIFHFGNLLNDWYNFEINHFMELCERRNRDLRFYVDLCDSFDEFLKCYGELFGLKRSENSERYLDDVIMNIQLLAGVNENVKDQYHHILETTMDEIREHFRDYGDIIIARHMVFDDEDCDEMCTHTLEDILYYSEYFEDPLRYIEFETVKRAK